jgi:hypothetical protein
MMALGAGLLLLPFALPAEDIAERRAAAERYEAIAGIERMLSDTHESLAEQLPEEKRARFIQLMDEMVDSERLRMIALDAMVTHFTAEELNALADFYGSDVGQSILGKFGAYNADVTPQVMQAVLDAAQVAQQRIDG